MARMPAKVCLIVNSVLGWLTQPGKAVYCVYWLTRLRGKPSAVFPPGPEEVKQNLLEHAGLLELVLILPIIKLRRILLNEMEQFLFNGSHIQLSGHQGRKKMNKNILSHFSKNPKKC